MQTIISWCLAHARKCWQPASSTQRDTANIGSESVASTQVDDRLVRRHHDRGVGNVLDELGREAAVHAADTLVTRNLAQRLPEPPIQTALFTHARTSHFYNMQQESFQSTVLNDHYSNGQAPNPYP